MNSRGLLVTGTDTGVGKTIVTAALACALRSLGLRVEVMKPVETGCSRSAAGLAPHDALLLRQAIGSDAALDLVCPYRFAPPVAPLVAAELAAATIDLERLTACWRQLAGQADVVLVEGAGGLAAPLRPGLDYAGLAQRWRLPLVLVIDNRLGCLSHARLTVAYAERTGRGLLGYVVNHTRAHAAQPAANAATASNPTILQRLLGQSCLGILPYRPAPSFDADLALERGSHQDDSGANPLADHFSRLAEFLDASKVRHAIFDDPG